MTWRMRSRSKVACIPSAHENSIEACGYARRICATHSLQTSARSWGRGEIGMPFPSRVRV
jgi:hypothetical protein